MGWLDESGTVGACPSRCFRKVEARVDFYASPERHKAAYSITLKPTYRCAIAGT